MLKVVGASWLQTRFATYILVAVALLGIGAIIMGEYGLIENDGIYAASVSYYKEGYHIDFWGQGNDLTNVRLGAARAYYKTGISESGWSVIEIETSSKYPDSVQAYAAGLLEGSLTWQLIHRHWYNTVHAVCERRAGECRKLMRFLRENTAIVRKRAEILAVTDSFWHMVRLFYIQLDGLEAGWRFAARRSRQEGVDEMDSEHFLWLAMANLMDLEQISTNNDFHSHCDHTKGMIILKSLTREGLDPLIAIGHTTAAPYAKMLRLLKKYTFAYHTLPKKAAPVPGRTVVMSSYPGALSSQDEFYLIVRDNRELIVAGTVTAVAANRSLWNSTNAKDQVMSPVRVMAANRLATDGRSWSRDMSAHNMTGAMAQQWVTLEPREGFVHLVERSLSGTSARAIDITERFANSGVFWITGEACSRETNTPGEANDEKEDENVTRSDLIVSLQKNITTVEQFEELMGGHSDEQPSIEDKDQAQILTYRGDLKKSASTPFGVIDAKIVLADGEGVASFDAISGPSTSASREPFSWSKSFPNVSHLGQPDVFDFDSVTPLWVWI
ncbi:putative phospholipase B-like lamina ancestor [Pseudomyrmex gracilis]|uniref:putative phospholipase B-like lamina ancestor n=1 Tax=Pseudomyrmex gracilis TaxID=219809 RepID=UPI000995D411|nr:putative phospholipase B-like lamina ancestor [Pseudomyrmex gracilis]